MHRTKVSDLSPLKGMPLEDLDCQGSQVTDLSPLKDLPLTKLQCNFRPERDAEILRSIKTLETINDKPAVEFWKDVEQKQAADQAWLKRIAALPAAQQVEEVRKELMRRNPGFDGKVEHKIEGDVVTELRIVTDKVTDISPIRVFNALRVLDCSGTRDPTNLRFRAQLADLSPLKGMSLAHLTQLNLSLTKVGEADMAHFKDCKDLTVLHLYATQVNDAGMAYFNDCKKLKSLELAGTKVTDTGLAGFNDCKDLTVLYLSALNVSDTGLAYFKDCKQLRTLFASGTNMTDVGLAHFQDCKKLTRLSIGKTKVTDLSLLKGMPLKELDCDFLPERDAEILRSIQTLETINGKPAEEFWKENGK